MRDTVYIYNGERRQSSVLSMMVQNFGIPFAKNGMKTVPIFAEDILKGEWIDNAAAIIFGGAESTIFRNALSPDGIFRKDIIRDAHQAGVHFAGYCGGAFIGWDHVEFKGAFNYKRQGEGFGLYPRKSFGAAAGFTPNDFTGRSDSAAIIPLYHPATGRNFRSLYCCGPYFPLDDMPPDAAPIAIARHPVTGEEVVMGVQIPAKNGCGSVTLYGHHPEYLADFIDFRTREIPSLPIEDARLRAEAHSHARSILLGYNLMLYDLKTAMGLMPDKPQPLIVPQPALG